MRLVKEMAADAKFQPALPREPLRLNEEEKKEIKKKKKKTQGFVQTSSVQFLSDRDGICNVDVKDSEPNITMCGTSSSDGA